MLLRFCELTGSLKSMKPFFPCTFTINLNALNYPVVNVEISNTESNVYYLLEWLNSILIKCSLKAIYIAILIIREELLLYLLFIWNWEGGYICSLRYTLFYSVHCIVHMKSITIHLNLTVQNGKIHVKGQWGMGVCSKLDTLIRHSALIMFS